MKRGPGLEFSAVRWIAAVALAALGCGDDLPAPCDAHEFQRDLLRRRCRTAHELAKRHGGAPIPAVEVVDRYARWSEAAREALPFPNYPVAAIRNQDKYVLWVSVVNPAIVAAWRSGWPEATGIAVVDGLIADMEVQRFKISQYQFNGEVIWSAEIYPDRVVSAMELDQAWSEIPGIRVEWWPEDPVLKEQDVFDQGEDADGGRLFDFTWGWDDCPAGCYYGHFWRVRVAPDDSASFVEEWGTPLPEYMLQKIANEPPVDAPL